MRPFRAQGRRIQVSNQGGGAPIWEPSGRELFYQQDDAIAVVRFDPAAGVPLDAPRVVYGSEAASWARKRPYEVLPDGGFVVVEGDNPTVAPPEMNVVLDWAQTLGSAGRSRP